MLFHSKEFLFFFFPLVVILFYNFFNNKNNMLIFIILSSLFFYAYFKLKYVFIIILSITINYYIINLIWKNNKKIFLTGGILFNISILIFFKYTDFFIYNYNIILDQNIRFMNIALPLAISFFTFQQIGFMIEAYFKNVKKINFLRYFAFITFFPQLIAGPILNYKELLPELKSNIKRKLKYKNIVLGLIIFTVGLFKKVIIADNFAIYVDNIFDSAFENKPYSSIYYLIGMLCFSFQIYFDFSAYSDMAVGIAKVLGFNLPINFNSPYRSKSFIEFWSKWHITLSRFIRTYLYQPILYFFLNNDNSIIVKIFNYKYITIFFPLIIAFSISGLWHGAAYGFILWGFLHGFFVSINYFFQEKNFKFEFLNRYPFLKIIFVFLIVSLLWIPFRCVSLDNTIIYYELIFLNDIFFNFNEIKNLFSIKLFGLIFFSFIVVFLFPNIFMFVNYNKELKERNFLKFKPNLFYLLFFFILLLISLFNLDKLNYEEFIYFQF